MASTAVKPLPRFEFDCIMCDRIEITSTKSLPDGWAEDICQGDPVAFCPDCVGLIGLLMEPEAHR